MRLRRNKGLTMGNLRHRSMVLNDSSSPPSLRVTSQSDRRGETRRCSCTRGPVHASLVLVEAVLVMVSGCSGNTETTSPPSPGGSPAPSWSATSMSAPAMGRLAYVHKSEDEASGGVSLVDVDGTKGRALTGMVPNVLNGQPDWSPDGKRVIFTETKNDNTDHASIRLITASSDGKILTPLTPGRPARGKVVPGYDDRGSYSPDGRHIAYVHTDGRDKEQLEHSNVYIMDADGKHARRVSKFPPFSGDVEGVAWSPDGQQLVFSYATSPISERPDQRALFLVNADGTHQRRLTPASLGAGGVPDWSAHTNLIVFRAVQDEESGIGNFFTIHPDGRYVAQVTHFDDTTVISQKVGFSPDGTSIIFAKGPSSPETDVFTSSIDGSNLHQVTDTPGPDTSPDWTPTT